jgi:transposase
MLALSTVARTGRASLTGPVAAGLVATTPSRHVQAIYRTKENRKMAIAIVTDSTRLVTGGVDTHKDTHVAAIVDHLGAEIATKAFPTTAAGYTLLLAWMRTHGTLDRVGIEGTGSWGAGLTRHLNAHSVDVVEINRPNRHTRRRNGKSDTIDALSAARAALAGTHAGTPKTANGPVEAIRMLRLARHSAVTSRTKTMNQIRAVIDTAPDHIRERYRHLTTIKLTNTISRTRPGADLTDPAVTVVWTLRTLGQRWTFLTHQIKELDAHLDSLVATTAPKLITVRCVGTHTAAALLVCAGDNPHRLRTEAAFAALCGTNPLPATSGRTTNRHRLNRAGNRDANNALWRIVMTRMAHDPRTRDYVTRRTTEGLSKREIIRCLKRYVAREIYPILITDLAP